MKIAKSFMKAFKWNEWNFNGEKKHLYAFSHIDSLHFFSSKLEFFFFFTSIKHGGAWNHNSQITASGVRTSV